MNDSLLGPIAEAVLDKHRSNLCRQATPLGAAETRYYNDTIMSPTMISPPVTSVSEAVALTRQYLANILGVPETNLLLEEIESSSEQWSIAWSYPLRYQLPDEVVTAGPVLFEKKVRRPRSREVKTVVLSKVSGEVEKLLTNEPI